MCILIVDWRCELPVALSYIVNSNVPVHSGAVIVDVPLKEATQRRHGTVDVGDTPSVEKRGFVSLPRTEQIGVPSEATIAVFHPADPAPLICAD